MLTPTCSHVSSCTSSSRIPLNPRSKSIPLRCPHFAPSLLSSGPLLAQGQPDLHVPSSFACLTERSPNLSLCRGEMGQHRPGFTFLMLLSAPGLSGRALPRARLPPRWATHRLPVAGTGKGSASRVRNQGGRNRACAHTRRGKVFLKHMAMHNLILEQTFTSNSHGCLLPI